MEKKQIDDKDVNVSADTMAETLRENSKMKSTMIVESPFNSELNEKDDLEGEYLALIVSIYSLIELKE